MKYAKRVITKKAHPPPPLIRGKPSRDDLSTILRYASCRCKQRGGATIAFKHLHTNKFEKTYRIIKKRKKCRCTSFFFL